MQYIQQPQGIEALTTSSSEIVPKRDGLPFRQPAARGDYQAGDPHHPLTDWLVFCGFLRDAPDRAE